MSAQSLVSHDGRIAVRYFPDYTTAVGLCRCDVEVEVDVFRHIYSRSKLFRAQANVVCCVATVPLRDGSYSVDYYNQHYGPVPGKRGRWRRAGVGELLAFGAQFPELQRSHTIVAGGDVADERWVLGLASDGLRRRLVAAQDFGVLLRNYNDRLHELLVAVDHTERCVGLRGPVGAWVSE